MKHVLMLVAMIVMLSPLANAVDPLEEQAAMLQTETLDDHLPADAEKLLGDASLWESEGFGKRMLSMIKTALDDSSQLFGDSLRSAKRILAVVVLTALGAAVLEGSARMAIRMTAVCALYLLTAADFGGLIRLGADTVDDLRVFSQALLPVMAAASAASGMTGTSAALYAGSTAFFTFLVSLLHSLLLPLVKAYLALSAADAALNGSAFSAIKRFVAGFIKNALRITIFAFTAYISLTGIVSGSADALSVKAAKITVSSVVPVVGSMISDASEAVLVSAKYLLHSVGIYGMLGALAVLLLPFLRLGIRYIIMNLTTFLASAFDCEKITLFLGDVSRAMGFLLGIVFSSGLMVYISCVCFMRVSIS